MSKYEKLFLVITLVSALITGHSSAIASSTQIIDKQNNSNDFAFKLFAQVAKNNKENVVISPFSAYVALSMTLNGAAGTTRHSMAKALGIKGIEVENLNQQNQAAIYSLLNNKTTQLEIGNAIFADINTPFKSNFIDTCKSLYNAEASNIDIEHKPEEAVTSINAWCNNKTHGKIPAIVSKLSAVEKMIILNSVYFKGAWQSPFKQAATYDDQFITPTGQKISIKMMYQSKNLSYLKGSDFQALSIPYKGSRQYMYIFLPNKNVDFALFQAKFTAQNWQTWKSAFNDNLINLSLPKFTINFSEDLSASLKAMGMAEAFDSKKADFADMIIPPNRAWISRVLQKTYMGVNEEGTEAAAVTAVIMGATCAYVPPKPAIDFKVDHPFVLALVDKDTDEILFLGSIGEPK